MEDKKAVNFEQSQAMPGRPQRDTVIALALVLLPIIVMAAVLLIRDQSGGEAAPVVPATQVGRDLSGAGAVDPADRKFLDGSYRLQVPQVASNAVDPAGIKFLNGSSGLGLPRAEYRLLDEVKINDLEKSRHSAAESTTSERQFLNGSYRLGLSPAMYLPLDEVLIVDAESTTAERQFLNGSSGLGLPRAEYRLLDEVKINDLEKSRHSAAESTTAETMTQGWINHYNQHRPR